MACDDEVANSESLSPDADRKLWLEYLSKLNDRELQSARASGVTTWVLLALAGAIVYKCVPQLPYLFSLPGALRQSLLVLVLGVDSLVFYGLALYMVLYYCTGGGIEGRVLPELGRRAYWVVRWATTAVFLALGALHFWSPRSLELRKGVYWSLVGLGAWWLLNVAAHLYQTTNTILAARKRGIPIPVFSRAFVPPNWPSLLLVGGLLGLGTVAATGLVSHLLLLREGSIGWLSPLAAAAYALLFGLVLSSLFLRTLASMSRGVYVKLERDILIEGLTATEIRHRFIAHALGPSIADWVISLQETVKQAEDEMSRIVEKTHAGLTEIAAIDEKYSLERRGRAQELLKDLQSASNERRKLVLGVTFKIRELTRVHTTHKERDILKRFLDEWEQGLDAKLEREQSQQEWRTRLEALAEVRRPP